MNWQYKKLTIIILLSLVGILIATVFMGLFLDGNVPWFGVEPKAGVDQPCIPMPFHVLFLIITAGIILGILIMRFLIFPLIRKEETP